MSEVLKAEKDDSLKANIIDSTELIYEEGSDEELDRPPHVRAASSITQFAEYLAVIQDDANFLAMIEPDHHHTHSIPLPAGPGGHRQFDPDRDNIHHKLDLEACVPVPEEGRDRLLAFGSGSSESREWILLVDWQEDGDPDIDLFEADQFFAHLRRHKAFVGSGLNIEGAIFTDNDTIRLFQRGNSLPEDGLDPVDGTADISWSQLEQHLNDPANVDPPEFRNIHQFDLGSLDGIRLTFSDAEYVKDKILYSASAEARDDSDRIAGSTLGLIEGDSVRYAEVIDLDGSAFRGKIEGLTMDPHDHSHVYFVIDDDQADKPSEIFKARLEGPWGL